ncbi:hypothetical protein AB835_10455 [Candidatus Endobugula sertula]|uniref:non-specific protein-tyrosine kinase n=1 Tax=Candidatus Endobugula sertula TaxID=62101 RepID=A0A1D2QNK8_9GAMM|nr:hypothetical protein AB835_10455 [Candidatus Endobugula sertula]
MSEISFNQPKNSVPILGAGSNFNPFGSESDIDFMHYYRLILRNLWKIILFSIVVGAFSALYALSLPPVYYSNTTLLIENQQPNLLSFQDVYQVDTRNRNYLGTQLEILKSRALASRVVDRMQLTRHPLFDIRAKDGNNKGFSWKMLQGLFRTPGVDTKQEVNADIQPNIGNSPSESLDTNYSIELASDHDQRTSNDPRFGNTEQLDKELHSDGIRGYGEYFSKENAVERRVKKKVVDTVMKSLVAFPIRGTQLVNIRFSAQDPQLAADIANVFADVYIESHLEAKLEVTQKASAWLSDRLSDLRQGLRKSEQALQAYREREKLVDTGDVRSIDVAELEQLTQSLVEATRKKSDTEALYRQMAEGNLPLDRLLALPIVSNNVAVQGLVESRATARRRVAELSKRYGAKHPKMLSAVSDVTEVEGELRNQVSNVASGVEVNFLAAKDAEKALKTQIAEVKRRLQSVNRKEFDLRELEREVEANRQVYEVFLNRGKETNEAGNLESVNARVVDAAIPAEYVDKPEKKKIVMIAVLFSGIFAAAVVLLLDFLDNTIKTPEDVEERLHVPLLGHLPLDKENKGDAPLLDFLADEKWNFAEAIRTIRTSFILSGLDAPAKVTVITSSVPNEGKSTVSLCLAQALGQMEKVLLLDGDMRRPSIGKALDISLLTPGLSNLIAGTAELDECVTRLGDTEVDVITAGVVLGNPLDQIAGDRFQGVLQMMKEKYDRIIIDSAPIQAVSDSIVIATHADALIYVVKSDGSPTPVIKRGLRRLSETSARFSGVVLNQVDIDKVNKSSGYEEGYYENYGYTGPEES